MGLVTAERNDDRQCRADDTALPVVQNIDDVSALALQIKGRAAMLGVIEHHDRRLDCHHISRLHELWINRSVILSRVCHATPTEAFRSVLLDPSPQPAAGDFESLPRIKPCLQLSLNGIVEFCTGNYIGVMSRVLLVISGFAHGLDGLLNLLPAAFSLLLPPGVIQSVQAVESFPPSLLFQQ